MCESSRFKTGIGVTRRVLYQERGRLPLEEPCRRLMGLAQWKRPALPACTWHAAWLVGHMGTR